MYEYVKWLAQPYSLLFVVWGVGLIRLRSTCKERSRWWWTLVVGYFLLWACSTSAVGHLVYTAVEADYPTRIVAPREGDVIVLLTGEVHRTDARRPFDEPGTSSLVRCHHAARVYRAGRCPVLIAGGKVDPSVPGRSNADIHRDCLIELGVSPDDIHLEEKSRNTAESAQACQAILEELGARRGILVTEAYHMRRSMLAFRSLGVPLAHAPCGPRLGEFRWSVRKFLPTSHGLDDVQVGLQELLGYVWYRLKGEG